MKKTLIKLGLVTALSTSLLGFTYEIKDGWQQLGAIEDIEDMTIFNNAECVDHVWYYDNNDTSNPQWRLHIADGNSYNYCGEILTELKKGQGFWVKATGNCTIEIDEPSCNSFGMPIPPSPDSCDANVTNPDNNATTNLSANTTVISSSMSNINADISEVIFEDKQSMNKSSNYHNGYFYSINSNAVIKIDEPFRLWTTISHVYPTYNAQVKITNLDTNQVILSTPYPSPTTIGEYYQMTNTLPAGTYRFENSGDYRMDDGWFFEAIR